MKQKVKPYQKMFWVASITAAAGYALWPMLSEHMGEVRHLLLYFKQFCKTHPFSSYLLYSGMLAFVLFSGLPVATGFMLLAGVTYGFWEAALLVTLCRLFVAVTMFQGTRHWVQIPKQRARHQPYLLKKMERHPNLALFMFRLMPIPDSVVNLTVAVSPIQGRHYVVVSLLGMIPFTLGCIWLGSTLGNVTKLIAFLR